MAKLTKQLRYFINKKVSGDSNWRDVEIVLSGPEVPGEGEHKIMEYIRLAKAQPGYNPNTRHCLYGLDADLIMLGLLSHDPHFALLREEVTFGRQNKKRKSRQVYRMWCRKTGWLKICFILAWILKTFISCICHC